MFTIKVKVKVKVSLYWPGVTLRAAGGFDSQNF